MTTGRDHFAEGAGLAQERERRERIGRERGAKAPRMWAEEDIAFALETQNLQSPPVPARLLVPSAQARSQASIMFVHGGGWAFGSIDASLGLSRKLAMLFDQPVFSVGYRLAPEHHFPAALNDVKVALTAVKPDIVVGASAGATLAMQAIAGTGAPSVKHAVLFSGVWQHEGFHDSRDPFLTASALKQHLHRYAPGLEPEAVRIDLSRLPQTLKLLFVCGEEDILFEANQALANKLEKQSELLSVPKKGHGFLNNWADDAESNDILLSICTMVKAKPK